MEKGENRCRRHALKRWFGSGEVSTDGLQGRSPPASIKHKTYFVHQARRAGRRSRRARRAQASAGSVSRAEPGKGENRFEPSVSRIWQKQNTLVYVCDILYICFPLCFFNLVCNRAPTHGGFGLQGAQPPASIKHKTSFVRRARRAGRRSRRARRAQASAGSASRAKPGKGENSIRAEC